MVTLPTLPVPVLEAKGCVLLGSCFSQYMGERMKLSGLPTLFNPLGTLFNPASIAKVMHALEQPSMAIDSVFYTETEDEWRSWLADTRLKAPTAAACAEHVRRRLQTSREALSSATYLFLTLGTNVCYRLVEDSSVVTNCQRQPDRIFYEDRLSLSKCKEALYEIIDVATRINPDIHIVLTVSPYRYTKYTMHGNQLAKSTLLLAEDAICQSLPRRCTYFPAYEIMLDELRDYRFYSNDMIHPSPEAQDLIYLALTGRTVQ